MSIRISASSSTKRMVSEGVVDASDTARSHLKEPAPTLPNAREAKSSLNKNRIV